MSHDFSSSPSPATTPLPNDFILYATILQSVAVVLLDIGSAEANATDMYNQEQDDICDELATIMKLLCKFDEDTSLSALEMNSARTF